MSFFKNPMRLAPWLLIATLAGCGSTATEDELRNSPEKLYAKAKDDLAAGSFEPAIKALERVEGRAAGTLLGQQATLDLAYAQWRTNERVLAIATLDRFIKLHPSSPGMDYALYLKGLINFNDNMGFLSSVSRQNLSERDQQASRDAFQAFTQLIEQFPESKYADDARARMDYIVNALADYEVHVARTTTAARPIWRRPTGPSWRCAITSVRRPPKKRSTSWPPATTSWGWRRCATTPSGC